ncbi:MAG: SRPBCC family protein [Saprospiraceae bacterium]
MVDVSSVIVIERPLEIVSGFASNPDNATTWYDNIKQANWKTEKPLKVGSHIDFVAHFLGKKLAYTYKVIEMSPEKFVMQTAQGPFPMETTYAFESVGKNSTKMTLRNTGTPTGFSRLVAPFMAKMMKKANAKDLNKLKKILES